MLKIVTVPAKTLTTPSKPVRKINQKIKKLVREMIEFLAKGAKGKPLGVGLSACQVGQPLRFFIAYSPKSQHYLTFINPKIIWRSKKMTSGVPGRKNPLEGCLSVPGVWGKVRRHQAVKISYKNIAGRKVTKKFSGFLAIVIQHESDHLNGILFVQRVLEQKGKLYKIEKDKQGKERLLEIEV